MMSGRREKGRRNKVVRRRVSWGVGTRVRGNRINTPK
jgi:hypothetical protein